MKKLFLLLCISSSILTLVSCASRVSKKEVAVAQKRRTIILETQSFNTNAIGFYLHQGFEIIGFDTCCYTNNDIGRKEARINLGFFFHREATKEFKK